MDDDAVDEEMLAELFDLLGGGDPAGLIHACELFLTDVPARLGAAEEALSDGRLEDVGRVAHSLRGSTGAFGARRISQLAERLEGCASQGGPQPGALLAEMRVEFASFRTILESRLSSITGS